MPSPGFGTGQSHSYDRTMPLASGLGRVHHFKHASTISPCSVTGPSASSGGCALNQASDHTTDGGMRPTLPARLRIRPDQCSLYAEHLFKANWIRAPEMGQT